MASTPGRRSADTGWALVGGDGSLHAAANVPLATLAELAIIPAGRADNIARSLGIPSSRPGALRTAPTAPARTLDVELVRPARVRNGFSDARSAASRLLRGTDSSGALHQAGAPETVMLGVGVRSDSAQVVVTVMVEGCMGCVLLSDWGFSTTQPSTGPGWTTWSGPTSEPARARGRRDHVQRPVRVQLSVNPRE